MHGTTRMILSATISLMAFNFPVLADENCKLQGGWQLVSFLVEDVATKARNYVYGEHPSGSMRMTCDGRFSAWAGTVPNQPVLSVWDDVGRSLAEESGVLRAVYYSGTYRVHADKLIILVDKVRYEGRTPHDRPYLTWTEAKSPAEEERNFRIIPSERGDSLQIETAPMRSPTGAGNAIVGREIWERVRVTPAN